MFLGHQYLYGKAIAAQLASQTRDILMNSRHSKVLEKSYCLPSIKISHAYFKEGLPATLCRQNQGIPRSTPSFQFEDPLLKNM